MKLEKDTVLTDDSKETQFVLMSPTMTVILS